MADSKKKTDKELSYSELVAKRDELKKQCRNGQCVVKSHA